MSSHDPDDLTARVMHAGRPPSPTRTIRVTPHTETLLRPLEPGEELCIRNESGARVFAAVDRSIRYLDGLLARIKELESYVKAESDGREEYRRNLLDLARLVDAGDLDAAREAARAIVEWEDAS